MTDIDTIKNLQNNHDKSIHEIADTLDINWRTNKNYCELLEAIGFPGSYHTICTYILE